MSVDKTPSSASLEERYAEIAKKTTDAIAAEGPPKADEKVTPVQPKLPELPRYHPPPPPRPPSPSDRRFMVCRMFFPTSGHRGFDTVKSSEELPPLEIVREMIVYETRLRLSNSIQKIMDEYHTDECAVT